MARKTFSLKNGYKKDVLGLQHAGGTNNSQLSAISQPCTRRVCVSRGVVQCFMLCYHRTWWRRSENGRRRRKCCERGKWERKIVVYGCWTVRVLVASYKVVVTLWYKLLGITSTRDPSYLAWTPPPALSLVSQAGAKNEHHRRPENFPLDMSRGTSAKGWEIIFIFPDFTSIAQENKYDFQFSFVCRGISTETRRQQTAERFYTSNPPKCVVYSCVRKKAFSLKWKFLPRDADLFALEKEI